MFQEQCQTKDLNIENEKEEWKEKCWWRKFPKNKTFERIKQKVLETMQEAYSNVLSSNYDELDSIHYNSVDWMLLTHTHAYTNAWKSFQLHRHQHTKFTHKNKISTQTHRTRTKTNLKSASIHMHSIMLAAEQHQQNGLNVFGWVNGGNTAAKQQTKWINVYEPYYARYSFSFSLPTSFSNGSLHDDRPVSIRYSKRSQRIFVVPNWAQFKVAFQMFAHFAITLGWIFLSTVFTNIYISTKTKKIQWNWWWNRKKTK